MTPEIHPATFAMPDGRQLYLYGGHCGGLEWSHQPDSQAPFSHGRWHPLRQEWVIYSAHRQSRTYKPASDACPFCPGAPDGEIPVRDFSIAVFDNRFSSFQKAPPPPAEIPGLDIPLAKAAGNCEVIVYSADHTASMATLPQERRELLVRVWGDRIRALFELPQVQSVMPFENRGEEAGVTLHHPHGQIYAFPYVPPVIDTMARSFRSGYDLRRLASLQPYVVAHTDGAAALVPPYARFPYEMWIVPRAFRPSPGALADGEVRDVATLLGLVAGRYDKFFGRLCPYVMIVYAAPRGMEDSFPFHIQFYPFLRTRNKLKFLAGCELGAGSFLVDVLPETAAQSLREAASEGDP